MLVDTHCHLELEAFNSDRELVIARARERGVERIVIPGLDLDSSRRAVELANQVEIIFAAVGIHPHNASTWDETSRDSLVELIQNDKVIAIGEIGLDFYRNLSTPEAQKLAFLAQLELAAEFNLPVVVHNREAMDPLLEILISWSRQLYPIMGARLGVLHAFSGDEREAQVAMDAGFFLGVAGPITFKNAHRRKEITSTIPVENVLLETDAPYLTPHPHRGQRNEPAYVSLVAEAFSLINGLDVNEVELTTSKNAQRLFQWDHEI